MSIGPLPTTSDCQAPAFLSAGLRWLLHSGIQEESGGVARYHHTDTGQNARVSTEITGYVISSLLDIYERTSNESALDAADHAGRFLAHIAWDRESNAMPFEWSADGRLPERHSCFFDNGIIARGLLRLWQATGEELFLDTAVQCGESMRRDFLNTPEHPRDIHPILELPSKVPIPRDARWSRQSGCYQLKSALAWLELAEATGDATFEAEYDHTLDRALATHAAFLDGEPGDRVMDRLHAYGYFLEAILPRASRPAVQAALGSGIARAAAELRRLRPRFERSDVCAQILRVRLWADQLLAVPLDEAAAAEEASWAAAYQMNSPAENIDGGFCFGSRDGQLTPFANPVSTAFCLQALALWHDRRTAGEIPECRTLV